MYEGQGQAGQKRREPTSAKCKVMVEEITTDKQCLNCVRLKQEVESSKSDKASTLKAIKDKIISTDKLIKKYIKKCDDYDKQTKQLSDLNRKYEECQSNAGDLQEQLQQALEKTEPQKKNITRLLQEKFTAEERILELKTKNDDLKGTISSLESALQLNDNTELAWKKQQQAQDKKLEKEKQRVTKLQEDVKKVASEKRENTGLLKKKAHQFSSSERKREKLESQMIKLKGEVRVLKIQCKNHKKNYVSTEAAELEQLRRGRTVSPETVYRPIDTSTNKDIPPNSSLSNIFEEFDGLNTPVLSPLPASQNVKDTSSSEDDSESDSDESLSDLGDAIELELGEINSETADACLDEPSMDSGQVIEKQTIAENQGNPFELLSDLNLSDDDGDDSIQSHSEMTDQKLDSHNCVLLQTNEVDNSTVEERTGNVLGEDSSKSVCFNENQIVGPTEERKGIFSNTCNLKSSQNKTTGSLEVTDNSHNSLDNCGDGNDEYNSKETSIGLTNSTVGERTDNTLGVDASKSACSDENETVGSTEERKNIQGLNKGNDDDHDDGDDDDKEASICVSTEESVEATSIQNETDSFQHDNTEIFDSDQEIVSTESQNRSESSNRTGNTEKEVIVDSKVSDGISCFKIETLSSAIKGNKTIKPLETVNFHEVHSSKKCDDADDHDKDDRMTIDSENNASERFTKVKLACLRTDSKETNLEKPRVNMIMDDEEVDDGICKLDKERDGFKNQETHSKESGDLEKKDNLSSDKSVIPGEDKTSEGNPISKKVESSEVLPSNDNQRSEESVLNRNILESNASAEEESNPVFTKIISKRDFEVADSQLGDVDDNIASKPSSIPCLVPTPSKEPQIIHVDDGDDADDNDDNGHAADNKTNERKGIPCNIQLSSREALTVHTDDGRDDADDNRASKPSSIPCLVPTPSKEPQIVHADDKHDDDDADDNRASNLSSIPCLVPTPSKEPQIVHVDDKHDEDDNDDNRASKLSSIPCLVPTPSKESQIVHVEDKHDVDDNRASKPISIPCIVPTPSKEPRIDDKHDEDDNDDNNTAKSIPSVSQSSPKVAQTDNADHSQDIPHEETNGEHLTLPEHELMKNVTQNSERELIHGLYHSTNFVKKRIAHRSRPKTNEITPLIEKNEQVYNNKESIVMTSLEKKGSCSSNNQSNINNKVTEDSNKGVTCVPKKFVEQRSSQQKRKFTKNSNVNKSKRKKTDKTSDSADLAVSCTTPRNLSVRSDEPTGDALIKTYEDLENNNKISTKVNENTTINEQEKHDKTRKIATDSEIQSENSKSSVQNSKKETSDNFSDSEPTVGVETNSSQSFCDVGESIDIVKDSLMECLIGSNRSSTGSSANKEPSNNFSEFETTVVETNLSQRFYDVGETEEFVSESAMESLIGDKSIVETDAFKPMYKDGTVDHGMEVPMEHSDGHLTLSIATENSTADIQTKNNRRTSKEDTLLSSPSNLELLCKADNTLPSLTDVLNDFSGVFSNLVPTLSPLSPLSPLPPPPQVPTPPFVADRPQLSSIGLFASPNLFSSLKTSNQHNNETISGSISQKNKSQKKSVMFSLPPSTPLMQVPTPPTDADRPELSSKSLFTSPNLFSSLKTSNQHNNETTSGSISQKNKSQKKSVMFSLPPSTPLMRVPTPPTDADRPELSSKSLFTSPNLFSSLKTSNQHNNETTSGSSSQSKRSRKKSKKNNSGLCVRPPFLSELQYAAKALKYLNRDDINIDDIVGQLSEKRNLSSGTPLAAALMVFQHDEEFMPAIMKSYADRNRDETGRLREEAQSLLSRFEVRVVEMITRLNSEEHLKNQTVLAITYLSKAIVYSYLKAEKEEPVKQSMASHCRIICALCREEGDLSRMRVLCYDVIRTLHSRPGTVLYLITSIAAVWPAVLSHPSLAWEMSGGTLRLCGPGYQPLLSTIHLIVGWLVRANDCLMLGHIIDWLCSWKNVSPSVAILQQLSDELVRLIKDPSFAELISDKDDHPVLGYGLYEVIKSLELVTCVLGWTWLNNVLIRGVIWDTLSSWANQLHLPTGTTNIQHGMEDGKLMEIGSSELACSISRTSTDGINQAGNHLLQSEGMDIVSGSGQQNSSTPICEATVVATIRLLGLVSRLAIQHHQNPMPNVIPMLHGILHATQTYQVNTSLNSLKLHTRVKSQQNDTTVTFAIQLATAYTLLEVSPWQPQDVSSGLKTWQESQPANRPLPASLERGLQALESSLKVREKQVSTRQPSQ